MILVDYYVYIICQKVSPPQEPNPKDEFPLTYIYKQGKKISLQS